MVMNVTKISQKMKNKRLMIIKKKYYRMRKNTLLKESILIQNIFLLYKKKYQNLFYFALMFETFSLNKQKI